MKSIETEERDRRAASYDRLVSALGIIACKARNAKDVPRDQTIQLYEIMELAEEMLSEIDGRKMP